MSTDFDKNQLTIKMDKSLSVFKKDLNTIRTGRANPAMLDLISIDALIVALSNYGGSLVFISHDVNFIRKLGNNVWHIKDGNLTKYAGDYDYYLEKSGGIADARAAITNWVFL